MYACGIDASYCWSSRKYDMMHVMPCHVMWIFRSIKHMHTSQTASLLGDMLLCTH